MTRLCIVMEDMWVKANIMSTMVDEYPDNLKDR